MSIPIIEFSEVDDYVAYLQSHDRYKIHLDDPLPLGYFCSSASLT